MLKIQSALACLLLVAALQTGAAQTVLTLEEALAAALANNYGILLAKNDSIAGAIDASYASGAFLPRVDGAAGFPLTANYVNQNFPEGNTPDRKGWEIFRSPSASINLNWTVFDGLKMFATRDRVEEIARLGEFLVRSQVVNTVAEVTTTYFDIVRQKQQLRAIEEQMSISEERVKVADRKLSTGLGSKPELLQASVDLNAQKALQLQQQSLIAQRKEALNLLAGLTLPAEFDVTDSIYLRTDLRLEDIENNLANANPDLILAQRNIGIAQLALQEREAERLPTVSLNSAYVFS
ncbi:MAG: TolC family protein, partial [Bacteroidota bacterium]